MSVIVHLPAAVQGCIGAADNGDGSYRLDFSGSSRAATAAEILAATKAVRIDAINAECRARLIAHYGDALEQVSRSAGIYGATAQANHAAGVLTTIEATNGARDAINAAPDIATVEAVAVVWPALT